MKYFFNALSLIVAGCFLLQSHAQNKMIVSSGTNLVTTSGSIINLQSTDLIVNGIINQQPGQGKFLFSGAGANSISGTSAPTFDVLEINKPGSILTLGENINIGASVNFTSGNIDVSNAVLALQPTAVLNSESNANHLLSSGNTGYATITTTLNAPFAVNPGNLGAVITSSQNLGSTIIKRGFSSQINGSNAGSSILRYYDITPVNDAGLNATLRISYFDNEVNGLNKTTFVFWKSLDNGATWATQGYTARDATNNYVELTDISDLSRWTVSSSNSLLPVILLDFIATAQGCNVALKWNTAAELNFSRFEIERSGSDNNYTKIGTVPAKGSNSSYNYIDNTPLQGLNVYRLKEIDIDNNFHYSDVASATVNCGAAPIQIAPNPVKDKFKVTGVKAGQQIIIYSISGQAMTQRAIVRTTEEFNIAAYAPGVYLVKIISEDGVVATTVKIIKY